MSETEYHILKLSGDDEENKEYIKRLKLFIRDVPYAAILDAEDKECLNAAQNILRKSLEHKLEVAAQKCVMAGRLLASIDNDSSASKVIVDLEDGSWWLE